MKPTLAAITVGGVVKAYVRTDLNNGSYVKLAWDICEEKIDASREFNLVNAQSGKISRAKKNMCDEHSLADEINPGEFYIYCGGE